MSSEIYRRFAAFFVLVLWSAPRLWGIGIGLDAIRTRQDQLRAVASSSPRINACNESRLVVITEFAWGNAGNQLISFTHGLYMAQLSDATLIVPHYMSSILHPFNLTLIRSLYCFKEEWDYEDPTIAETAQQLGLSYTHVWSPPPKYRKKAFVYPPGSQVMEIESELCFFLYRFIVQLQRTPHPMLHVPPSIAEAKREASALFVRVYCALWANPVPSVIAAADLVLRQRLHSNLGYSAAHKRAMEGGCSKVMSHVTTPSDFDPSELPMGLEMWRRIGRGFHPLCDMPAQLVLGACELHYNKSLVKSGDVSRGTGCGSDKGLFVAFDGRGDVSDFRSVGAVFSGDVDYSTMAATATVGEASKLSSLSYASTHDPSKIDKKFVDMFLAIHAAFFVLNPRSTFSWEIYVVRIALSLPSVPVMRNKDLYVLHPDDYNRGNGTEFWVGWISALEAVKEIIQS